MVSYFFASPLIDTHAYNLERIKFLKQYIGTSEDKEWKLDSFYYKVRNANSWVSARLAFEYKMSQEMMRSEVSVA